MYVCKNDKEKDMMSLENRILLTAGSTWGRRDVCPTEGGSIGWLGRHPLRTCSIVGARRFSFFIFLFHDDGDISPSSFITVDAKPPL